MATPLTQPTTAKPTHRASDLAAVDARFPSVVPERWKRATTIVHFERGATIASAGTPCTEILALASGAVKLLRPSRDTEQRKACSARVLDVLRAPAWICDPAWLDGGAWSASVVTLRASVVLRTPRAELQTAMTSDLPFFDVVARTVAAAQRALVDRIDALGDGDAEARLARLFDGLASRYGTTVGDAPFVALPLRRDEIASMIGVTTETASRITARWTRENRLRATRDGILWRKL